VGETPDRTLAGESGIVNGTQTGKIGLKGSRSEDRITGTSGWRESRQRWALSGLVFFGCPRGRNKSRTGKR